jgi:hypothetical protein
VPFCWILPSRLAGFGGKGIRTPDFQLAKLALYQLSYAPARTAEMSIADLRFQEKKMPDVDLAIVIRHLSMCSSKD